MRMIKLSRPTAPRTIAIAVAALSIVALSQLPASPAHAQLLDQLKGAVGSGSGDSAVGGLAGGVPKVGQASPSNTAGLLQYCVRNNYLSGGAASSVKDSLLGKATGSGNSSQDAGFQSGNQGVLQTGKGQNFNLGGGGIKQQVTHKICALVLQHAKSML